MDTTIYYFIKEKEVWRENKKAKKLYIEILKLALEPSACSESQLKEKYLQKEIEICAISEQRNTLCLCVEFFETIFIIK